LHALDPFAAGSPAAPAVWRCEASAPAVVLGSRQQPSLLRTPDGVEGFDVVRRRSGGGIVVIDPFRLVWIDLIVPHGVAPDDVRGAMVWAGGLWRTALAAIRPDLAGRVEVHRGGMVATDWSDLLCFAGLGPGEVLLDGRKLVGLSQRRTNRGLRIQGLLYRAPLQLDVTDLLAPPLPAGRAPEIAVLDVDPSAVAAALAAAIDTLTPV
jgi:lipoate-protein ligase A